MTWAAVAIGGAALLGGILGGRSSKKAASQQANAATQASQLQNQQFQQTRSDLAPWMQQGQASLSQLGQLTAPGGQLMQPFGMEQFQQSPAYQFNLEQGMDAINKATRARRTNYAPATLQDIGKYSQGMASNEFLNAYNMYNQDQGSVYSRLMGMSQLGENAGAQTGAFGNQSAQAQGGYMTDAGAARAAGTMGQANAWAGALQQGGNAWLQSNALRGAQQPNYVPMGQAFTPANQQQMNEMMGPWS